MWISGPIFEIRTAENEVQALLLDRACKFHMRRRISESSKVVVCTSVVRTNGDTLSVSVSQSYVTTDGQSASLSWNKAPIWGLRPDFYYCQTIAGLLMWNALSDERTGLSFTIVAGPRQRSHSRVRVPWNLRPYFTVSDSRLPFSSPPTTCRVTVEVFNPAFTGEVDAL
jgi:hypothetical protein